MILNPENKVAIDLEAWHYWFPVWPIRITTYNSRGGGDIGVWRWMYVVQRRCVYVAPDTETVEPDIYYRDLVS